MRLLTHSRILLIEDDPNVAVTVSRLLAGEGYSIETEADGETGLARALERTWTLVILNAILPTKTGFHVCCDLRQAGVDTAILMLTARLMGWTGHGPEVGHHECLAIPSIPPNCWPASKPCCAAWKRKNCIPVRTFSFDDVEMDFDRAEVHKVRATPSSWPPRNFS